jgi:hypothetical protein
VKARRPVRAVRERQALQGAAPTWQSTVAGVIVTGTVVVPLAVTLKGVAVQSWSMATKRLAPEETACIHWSE